MKSILRLLIISTLIIYISSCKKSGDDSHPVDNSGSLLDTKIEKILNNADNTASMKITVEGLRYTSNLTGVLNYNCDVTFTAVTGSLFKVKLRYKFRRFPSNYTDSFGDHITQPANGTEINSVDAAIFPLLGIYQFPTDPGPLDLFEATLP